MQLNGKNSSTVSKSIDSRDSKEYTENNISLTSLTLSRLGASHTAQEKIHVRLCGSIKFVGVASISFHFVSFLDLLAPYPSRVVGDQPRKILQERVER